MRLRKAIILILVVFMLIIIVGCKKNPQVLPPQVTTSFGEITDPVELEKLWQVYFYDSIATVGNTREFNSAQEIEPLYIAMFAWNKYVAEYGKESLALAGKDSSQRLFPLAKVLEYAKRYFNLTSLDVSNIEEHYYDQEQRAFLFNFGTEQPRPNYNSGEGWGEKLAKATRNSDGTITAVLVREGQPRTGRIELTKTYSLKQREDGSLYFVSGRWDYVNNHLVSLMGDYQSYDKIAGFKGEMEELFMLGEVEGKVLLAHTPYQKGQKASLLLVDPDTMKVAKRLELRSKLELTDVRLLEDKIVVYLSDRIVIIDRALVETKELPIPPAIKTKIERKPNYDKNGIPDIFFGGYDISTDLQRIVYADEIGVKLYNLVDNSEKLIAPSVLIEGSKLDKYSWHRAPRFVANEEKVITTMTAYEGTRGYTLINLTTGISKTYDISSEGSSTGLIRYDSGLLEVNTFMHNSEEYETLYLDFKTGEVQEIKLQEPGDTGYIRMADYSYVGQEYGAFLNNRWDSNDNAQSMFYLNRLNLKTMKVDTNLVTVKAAQTHILGVLTDGRIIFWYNYNPSENGVGITK